MDNGYSSNIPRKCTGEIIAFLTNGVSTINYPPTKKSGGWGRTQTFYFMTYTKINLKCPNVSETLRAKTIQFLEEKRISSRP